MKKTITILLFSMGIIYGQCDIIHDTDKFDHHTSMVLSGRFETISISKSGELIFTLLRITHVDKTETFSLYGGMNVYYGTKCLKPGTKLIFLLDNGVKVELLNTGNITCSDGSLLGYYYINKDQRSKLLASPISDVRIYTTETYDDFELKSTDNKNFFINYIKCFYP